MLTTGRRSWTFSYASPNMLIESAADIIAAPIDIAPVLALLRAEGLPTTAEPLPPAVAFPATAASMGLSMQQNAVRPNSSAAAPAMADRRTVAEQRAQAAAVAAAMAVAGTGVFVRLRILHPGLGSSGGGGGGRRRPAAGGSRGGGGGPRAPARRG